MSLYVAYFSGILITYAAPVVAEESGEGYLIGVTDQMDGTIPTLRGDRLPSRHLREEKGLNSVAAGFRVIVTRAWSMKTVRAGAFLQGDAIRPWPAAAPGVSSVGGRAIRGNSADG